MKYSTILIEKKDSIATITLNRPEKMNGWNATMMHELPEAIGKVAADDDVQLIIFAGTGKHFSIGGDVSPDTGFVTHERFKTPETYRQATRHYWQKVVRSVWEIEKPTIAMTRGWVAGEGMGLALACDVRIGSETTRFLVAPTRFGTFCLTGEAWLLMHNLGLSKTMQIYLCSEEIKAEEAHRIGLLNWLVKDEELEKETNKLAGRLSGYPPIGMKLAKMFVRKMIHWDFDTALEMIAASAPNAELSEDHQETINAFIEKRKPKPFKGA